MIGKLIQNLEIKMESQINSLETKIEKMQEKCNKDLEEIKESQYIMNNAINEIKNTLEATNSRITEAEDRISAGSADTPPSVPMKLNCSVGRSSTGSLNVTVPMQ